MAMQSVVMVLFAPYQTSRTTMANGGEDLGILNSEIVPAENVRLAVFQASKKFLPQTSGPTCT